MNQNKSISRRWLAFLTGAIGALACVAQDTSQAAGPAKVQVRQENGRWQLYVNQQPFFIKGAGLERGDLRELAACGGNSLRTWSTANAEQILDRALKNGVYVTMGLDVARERHGFDYSDPQAVAGQLARIKSDVLKFKDHPALLMWDIGNELNLKSHNPKVWDAVNDISKMIHQVDPNHPTTTSVAGLSENLVSQIKTRAPDLDLLSIQMYADLINLPRRLRETGWTGPYVVSEWGASGHWEVGKTKWGAPIEEDSSKKSSLCRRRYEIAIAGDPAHCLGSYLFLWGQKQERTPTWFGLFLESGAETEMVDDLQYAWTGRWPALRCPQLKSFRLDGKSAPENIHLNPGQNYTAKVLVQSPDHGSLTYSWELMEESRAQSIGGDRESRPATLSGLILAGLNGEAQIKAPIKPGAYRLYVYALDTNGKAAYANIPFYVDAGGVTAASQP